MKKGIIIRLVVYPPGNGLPLNDDDLPRDYAGDPADQQFRRQ